MPNLETALPTQSIAANTGGGFRRPGLLESLTAPGVSAIPSLSSGSEVARSVLASVGAVGQVAGQIGNMADEERRRIEADVRKELVEGVHRGKLGIDLDPSIKHTDIIRAHRLARMEFEAGKLAEQVEAEADAGNFTKLIQPGEDAPAAITRMIAEATPDATEEERAAFAQAFTPQAKNIVRRSRDRMFEETAQGVFSSFNAGFDSADRAGELTPEKATSLLHEAKKAGAAFRLDNAQSIAAMLPSMEAVANRGGNIEAFIDELRQAAPDKAERLVQVAEAARRQKKNIAEADAVRKADELEASGAPLASYQNFVQKQRESGAISGLKAQQLISRHAVSQARLAAERGSYLEVDAITKHTHAKDADTQLVLGGLREQAVARYRKQQIEIQLDDAIDGRGDPTNAIDRLNAMRQTNRVDPDNPNGITFDQYRQAIGVLESSLTKMDDRVLGVRYVDEALQSPGGLPVTAEHAPYVELQWSRDGVAAVQQIGGKTVFSGVTAPEVAAARSAAMQYVLPAWSKQIGQTMSAAAGDSPQLRVAMRSLAALHIRNPNLALQVRENLSDAGKARADFLIEEIERSHALALDAKGQPNKEWTDRIGSLVAPMLQVKPVALSKDDTTLALWDTKFDDDVQAAAIGELGKQLPEGLDNTKFTFGFGRDVAIGNAAANLYADYARQEYRSLISRGVPDAKAAETAKKVAGQRLLGKHPPILWNSVVAVGPEAPHPFTAEHVDELTGLLKEQIKAGKLSESIGFYEENFRPRWNPAAQGGQWTLVDGDGNELEIDGKLVGFRPEVKISPAYSEAKKSMETKARERKELWWKEYGGMTNVSPSGAPYSSY